MLKEVKRDWSYYVFSFLIVSMGMWFLELLYSLVMRFKLVNPGFLYGPWCPIYGTGFIFCILLINKKHNRIYNFFKMFIILSLVEYITSVLLEYIFDMIIWDYTVFPFDINGRVCLHMSIIFALLGDIIIYHVEPILKNLYKCFKKTIKPIIFVLLFIFLIDVGVSWLL